MSPIPVFLMFWLFFLVPAVPVAVACWLLGRRRVRWFKWEYALLIVPYLTWLIVVMIKAKGKSLSNAVAEPFFLGCGVALASVARVVVGRRTRERTVAAALFAAVCLLAIALWAFVPTMPE